MIKPFYVLSLLAASTSSIYAYGGFNDCQRYTGLSDNQQNSYTQSSICVPVANVSDQELIVTLFNNKNHGDQQTIGEGNVGEFTHISQVPRGTSYDIAIQTKNNKIIYDSRKGKDAKVANLTGLICMKSLSAKEAAKTIKVIPEPAKLGPIKCVPWLDTKPQSGSGAD